MIERLDHVGIVVNDLEAAVAFFVALGMQVEGRAPIAGEWVDRVNGLRGIRADIATMRTPDGHGRVELTTFHSPAAVSAPPAEAMGNVLGLRSLMFAVDDLDAVVTALERHGGVMIGDIARYEDAYRLCAVRGPAGIIVSLAEALD